MSSEQNSDPTASRWWVAIKGAAQGPFEHTDLVMALRSRELSPSDLACLVGTEEWKPLAAWSEFQEVGRSVPVPPPLPRNFAADQKHPLVNSQLPLMANWICVYCIAVIPLLWVFNNIPCLMTFTNRSLVTGMELATEVAARLLAIPIAGALVLGGLRLRDLRLSGCTIIRTTIWIEVALLVVFMITFVVAGLAGAFAEDPESTNPISAFDMFGMMVNLAAFGFEITSLIWLYRYGKMLPYITR